MRPGDAARVLAACALFDNRKVPDDEDGERLAKAWYAVIGDLDLADAMEAVRRHYRDSRDWIMPSDIRAQVKRIKAERRMKEPHEARQLPSRMEPDPERRRRTAGGVASAREVLAPLLARIAEQAPPNDKYRALDELLAITGGSTQESEGVDGEEGQ